jgi:Helicase associated domain/Type III restriction enzyme, res subunit
LPRGRWAAVLNGGGELSWDALSDKWEEGFFHLKEFFRRAGHCRMLAKYKTGNGFGLGIWVNKQRERKDTIEPDRRQRLEALPGWTWALHSDKREKGFSHLKEFSERENHCRVAALYKTNDGHRLGQWTQVQTVVLASAPVCLVCDDQIKMRHFTIFLCLCDQWRRLMTHFESAAVDYPDNIERLSVGRRKPLPEPRVYQIEAIENVISGFQKASRGQLVMACGTGKTFVCLWVKERMKVKRTFVLIPSLGLLSQILNDWTFAARDKFDALCVCSDQTVRQCFSRSENCFR